MSVRLGVFTGYHSMAGRRATPAEMIFKRIAVQRGQEANDTCQIVFVLNTRTSRRKSCCLVLEYKTDQLSALISEASLIPQLLGFLHATAGTHVLPHITQFFHPCVTCYMFRSFRGLDMLFSTVCWEYSKNVCSALCRQSESCLATCEVALHCRMLFLS